MNEGMTADQYLAAKQDWKNRARKQSQQVRKRRPIVHRVYELLFPDGKIYVGVTKLTWNQREYHHRRSLSVVGRRLEMFPSEPPRLEYLHEVECDCGLGLRGCGCRGEAEELERERILDLPVGVRLNVVSYEGKVRPMSPVEDWQRRVDEGLEDAPLCGRCGSPVWDCGECDRG